MSNFLAPAVVAETLRQLLAEAADQAVPGALTTLGRPLATTDSDPPGINICALRVNFNSAFAASDLPTRRSNGALVRRPQIGLDVEYLLSFRGNETDLEPQRLMGRAVSLLHARPVLTSEAIQQAVDAAVGGDQDHFMQSADLAQQVEAIRMTPLQLSLEDMSKLWSVFFQAPYVLSIAYQASVLLIEEETDVSAPSLPVREPRIFVEPIRRLNIERIESIAGPEEPIHAHSTVRVIGTQLGGTGSEVILGRDTLTPASSGFSGVTVDLADWSNPRAGILPLRVVHRLSDQSAHLRFESNVMALKISPRIEALDFTPAAGGDPPNISVETFPGVQEHQEVILFLNQLLDPGTPPEAEAAAYAIDAPPRVEPVDEITFVVPTVQPGNYLVRLRVDGADSSLETDDDPDSDTFGRYTGPTLEVA